MKLTTGYKKPIASSGDDAQEQSSNNSYLLLAGGGHKALSELISPADITAGKVSCTAATSNTDRPILVTNESNGLYYTTKVKLNYSTGIISAGGLSTPGNVVLHNTSGGDSPHLHFQRAGQNDGAYDWDMYVKDGGIFKIRYNDGSWHDVFSMPPNNIYTSLSITSDIGFVKSGSSNDYALMGGGGHKNISNVQNTAFYKRVVTVNGSGWDMAGTNSSTAFIIYSPTTAGTSGQILQSTGGTPTWINQSNISAGKLNGYTANDFIQNITVRNVITGAPGTNAEVKATKTNSDVILDFTIPRGYQGDMAEKEDAGYTNSKGDTVVDYCEAILKWQFLSDPGLNYEFVNILQVPIPSYDLITSLIDCIKMNQQVTLAVGDKGQTYTWNQLHWSLQCSNKDNIVYVTKYGTNHTDFYFGVDNNNNGASINAINTIEIVVTCKPDPTDSTVGEYYIQVTVENEYGRAYYTSTKILQKVIT